MQKIQPLTAITDWHKYDIEITKTPHVHPSGFRSYTYMAKLLIPNPLTAEQKQSLEQLQNAHPWDQINKIPSEDLMRSLVDAIDRDWAVKKKYNLPPVTPSINIPPEELGWDMSQFMTEE